MTITRRFATVLAVLVASLLPILAAAQDAPPIPARGPAWTGADCATFDLRIPDGAAADCGFLSVSERRGVGASRRIDLAVAILAPVEDPAASEPLFIAQGGPGGGTIGSFAQLMLDDVETRPARDRPLVLWDQRGTGFSKPALTCPELSDAETAAAASGDAGVVDDAAYFAALKTCGARLKAQGIDFVGYNSAENADDVEALRATLGYDRIAFYGVSYGTELGQFVMRRHPEHLSAVVLDAVVPLDYDLFIEPAFAQQRIGEKYLLGCAAAPRCAAAFPDLATRYLALIDRLNADPVEVTVAPLPDPLGQTAPPIRIPLTGDLLEGAIYSALYSGPHDLVPLIVDRADKGDFTLVTALLLPMALFDDSIATGMHLTVSCANHGDVDPGGVDFSRVLPRIAEQTRSDAALAARICQDWNIPLLPRADLAPVASELPVLLLSGDFDPITPPSYAEKLLPTLPNATHVIFPAGAHGQAMTNPCANEIIGRFLDDPSAKPDTSCVGTETPEFITSEDVIFLGTLQRLIAAEGVTGIFMSGILGIPAVLAALLLATSFVVYPVGALIKRVRGLPARPRGPGFAGWLARAAPWIAASAAVVALLCVVGIALAMGSTLAADGTLAIMGAVPARWAWVFALPALLGVIGLALLLAAVAIWATRQRSLFGRIYLSLLTVAALGAAANLALLSR
jgi:pimeloyl-ACP methyl ester carboxylesterase